MLNCKPGDLAVIVKSATGKNLGKIVRCIRIVNRPVIVTPSGKRVTLATENLWEIDQRISARGTNTGIDLGYIPYIADHMIRPLRDNPGQDETLRWAGKPKTKPKTKANAKPKRTQT